MATQQMVSQLTGVLDAFEAKKAALLASRNTYAQEYIAKQLDAVKATGNEQALALTRQIFGAAQTTPYDPAVGKWSSADATTLIGGAFWPEWEAVKARHQAARDMAETLDPARVQLAAQRLPTVLSRQWNEASFWAWYGGGATSYEKRALQMTGAAVLQERFGEQAVHIITRLQADYQRDMLTPQVSAARAAIDVLDKIGIDAVTQVERAAALFGDQVNVMGVNYGGGYRHILTLCDRAKNLHTDAPAQWSHK